MPNTILTETKTADDFRASAAEREKRAADSFERCDTDGFLSQWASGINAQLDRTKAGLIEDGKTALFDGLFEGDRRVKAKIIRTQFGSCWLLHDDEADLIERRGKKFLPTGDNSRVLRDLGLRQAGERAPAWAAFGGEGRGLGSLTSVRIDVFRTGDPWGMDAIEEED